MSWKLRINEYLSKQRFSNKWRERYIIDNNTTRLLKIDKKNYINFSSNDYLGLNQHPLIINSWKKGLYLMGAGSGSSSHIIGFSRFHADLERQLATWLGYPRALLFISGFDANQAVINLLAKKNDHIIADKLIHASLIDAALRSSAKLHRFNHNVIENLNYYLKYFCKGDKLVITEGIFSMDGDRAPLKNIYDKTKKHNGWLLVDDAHGIGVIGNQGRGSCYFNEIKPDILTISFSKAFGISGAALLCDEDIANYFWQFSKNLTYSTCMAPAQTFALQASLTLIQQGDYLRQRLNENINYFKLGIQSTNWNLIRSTSAIQSLIIGNNDKAKTISSKLANSGCWVNVIKPPTVPTGTTRLRLTLTAAHKFEDIDILLEALHNASI
ncbi:8-amino-7-oxononanoate synthase [Candidatus Pantoea edessiphila]|uniref:8-amino-7-oxononanoate synthase n=1 Tax=Candidatus Pantoea edessiphila TaxID=2044610 RepID=A0A2P5T0H9_9GAMM|nr:8-amino-7-oxononanoate synthase [Candidatus Pantoea edessiphila]PPI88066.1 8-amino-7-oxononanoate synthase [Candidatus Pantoea edessiphila]